MHVLKRKARARAATTDLPDLSGGLDPGPADLPAPRVDVPRVFRDRAALIVLAIGRGWTPEEIARGLDRAIIDFTDDLHRAEALCHVDLLLEAVAA
jgi:hypothetical protein